MFFLLSLSKNSSEKLRYFAASSLSPAFICKRVGGNREDIKNLSLENSLLKRQVEAARGWLTFDQRVEEEFQRLKEISKKECDDLYWKGFFRRRCEALEAKLKMQLQALPAKVILRQPASWNSSLWIDVGSEDNERLGRLIVAKNSPVVVGDMLVGILEYVGKKRSRVRLVTDSGLVAAVRAVRGEENDRELLRLFNSIIKRVDKRDDIFETSSDKRLFLEILSSAAKNLSKKGVDYHLAKGELRGSKRALFGGFSKVLEGVGFNYNYSDSEGPSRDLKSGKTLDERYNFLSKPILKEGDLLITSGMDGIFPEGLKVASVTSLIDCDHSYKIEATALAPLFDLKVLFVMPPIDFFQ